MRVYLDTGALIALLAANDRHHRAAASYFRASLKKGVRFLLGRPVLVEYLDGVAKRVDKATAIEELRRIESSSVLLVEPAVEEDWERARDLFLRYDGQAIDLTDSLSFAMMERLHLAEVFTFDPDFAVHGFSPVPRS